MVVIAILAAYLLVGVWSALHIRSWEQAEIGLREVHKGEPSFARLLFVWVVGTLGDVILWPANLGATRLP